MIACVLLHSILTDTLTHIWKLLCTLWPSTNFCYLVMWNCLKVYEASWQVNMASAKSRAAFWALKGAMCKATWPRILQHLPHVTNMIKIVKTSGKRHRAKEIMRSNEEQEGEGKEKRTKLKSRERLNKRLLTVPGTFEPNQIRQLFLLGISP